MAPYVFKNTVAGIPENDFLVFKCKLLPHVRYHGKKCDEGFSYLPWDDGFGKVVTVVVHDVSLTTTCACYII